MSKSKLIEEGKNVEIDGGITVINEGVSLAEKVEEKVPEVVPVEQAVPVVEPVVAPVDPVVTPTAPIIDPTLASPVVPMPEVAPIPGFTTPVTPVDPMAAINPEFAPTVDPVTSFVPVYPPYTGDPTYANQVAADEASGNQLFASEANVVGVNDFGKAYEDVSYEKVATTIVNLKDAQEAKQAYMVAVEELYDKGPGNQVNILRKVAAQMDKLLEEISNQGFVSGPNHEAIKKARLEYRGLQEIDNKKTFSDNNQDYPNFGGMNF